MTVLSRSGEAPLYIRVRETLRDRIKQGQLSPGQKLPAEDELAAQFGVSRMTLRQGIADLTDAGVLYRRRGIGTFIAQRHVERDHNKLTDFTETAQAEGVEVKVRTLKREVVHAKLMVANLLALSETEPVVRIETLRLDDGLPVTVYDEYVPYKFCPELLQQDLPPQPVWRFLENRGCKIRRAVQKIEARQAEAEMAILLEMEEGAPLLYKQRVVMAEDGTPIELILCYNRGDRYSMKMTLIR
jgi:GntR family transcriptional regulator